MLKIRRECRRTSSSQAEPSPWRHCWTSWASCSNVSSASNPGTVTCATTLGQFLVNRGQPGLGLPYYGHQTRWAVSNRRILLIRRQKHNDLAGSSVSRKLTYQDVRTEYTFRERDRMHL